MQKRENTRQMTQSQEKTMNADSPFRLDDKVALVTGAGRGIGRACAKLLATSGAHVIAVARTATELDSLQAEHPESIETWCEDVTRNQFIDRLAGLRQLDVLVNNVGTNTPQPFVDVDIDVLDSMLALNVRTAFLVAQAAARIMVNQGSGSIIHMSSQMGHVGAPLRTVYCMSKHALEGLTKAMAVELAPAGVRVNSVAPTFIETPLTKPMLDNPEFRKDVLSRIPLDRLGQVEEVAAAVVFLASPAASLVTGDSLKVDGGWTAR
jgi:NAD(P)-dependent dehydrogenase (short-subunit alcohol dehydrogenase family)